MLSRIELVVGELPNGVVKAHDLNWSGEALIFSKSKIESALKGDTLDVSGVYILSGFLMANGDRPEEVIYIGSGDSVRDRIQSHNNKKLFWRTAIVFYRPVQELHLGNIRYIESRLIQLALSAKAVLLDNINSPKPPTMPDGAKEESEAFVDRCVLYLRALGLDFFTAEDTPPLDGTRIKGADDPDPMGIVPDHLRKAVEVLRAELVFPQAMFYSTKSPDVRAKVSSGGPFRVFARLKFQSKGIRLELKDVDNNIFVEMGTKEVSGSLKEQIKQAYELALEKVSSAGGLGTANTHR